MAHETRVPIRSDPDIVTARQQGRALAAELSLPSSDMTLIAAAISEIARNILVYAQKGEIELSLIQERGKKGVMVIARDQGPGIPNIAQAMEDGFTTGHGLGLGLPGAKRLMDEFEVVSAPGQGTTVTMKKWAR